MDPEKFKRIVLNPKKWFEYARMQKKVGDSIIDTMIKKVPKAIESAVELDETIYFWINAHFHYGIGLENGMKGIIVKEYPDDVFFLERGGKVYLEGIGRKKNKNHDLVLLAEDSNLFSRMSYAYDKECEILKEILGHLGDAIRWAPKYPAPMNNEAEFEPSNRFPPTVISGFRMLDIIDPVFELFDKYEKQNDEGI